MAAIAPVLGPILSAVGTLASSLLAPSPPEPAAPPPPPEVEPAPEVPSVASVDDVQTQETQAASAQTRALKRRRAAEDKQLFALGGGTEETSVILSKSLLGD